MRRPSVTDPHRPTSRRSNARDDNREALGSVYTSSSTGAHLGGAGSPYNWNVSLLGLFGAGKAETAEATDEPKCFFHGGEGGRRGSNTRRGE